MKCPNCGTENEDGMKFCGECGTPLPQEKKCPNCGAMVPLKMKFCGECGCRMDGASANAGSTGGLSMGDKNVIAGDVIGKKEDYTIAGNATIVKNEDESRKILSCAVCGKHLLNSEAITCPKCGKTVCTEHFNRGANECSDCAKIKTGSKIDAYNAKLAEVYADGKVDFDERRELDELASSLGISGEQAGQLEAKFKSNMDDENSLTRAEKYEIENAKKLLLKGDSQEAAKIMEPLYARFGDTNVRVFSLYLRALKGCDAEKAKRIIASVKVDIPETYITQIDFALAEENLGDAERLIKRAKKLFPDDVVVRCKEAEYLFLFAQKTGDENIMGEFNELVESLPEGADEYEQWCVSKIRKERDDLEQKKIAEEKRIIAEKQERKRIEEEKKLQEQKRLEKEAKAREQKKMAEEQERRLKRTVSQNGNGDFTSIQQAINAVEAGCVITIKKGAYKEQIEINKNVTLVGEGSSADDYPIIYFKPTERKDDVVKITSPCILKNVCVQSDDKRTGVEYKYEPAPNALIRVLDDATLQNVTVRNFFSHGIYVESGNPKIDSCDISYVNYNCFTGKGTNPNVSNTIFHDRVDVENGCNGQFENCKIERFVNLTGKSEDDSEYGAPNPVFKSCEISNDNSCVSLIGETKGKFIDCKIFAHDSLVHVIDVYNGAETVFESCEIYNSDGMNMIANYGRAKFINCKYIDGQLFRQDGSYHFNSSIPAVKYDGPDAKIGYKGSPTKFSILNWYVDYPLIYIEIRNDSPWQSADIEVAFWITSKPVKGNESFSGYKNCSIEQLNPGETKRCTPVLKHAPKGKCYATIIVAEFCADGKCYENTRVSYDKKFRVI